MRSFEDGEELTIEPFRADAFPVIKDLIVDRSALDKIVSAGGYVSVKTGSAPEASTIPIKKEFADAAMDAAEAAVAAAEEAKAATRLQAMKRGNDDVWPGGSLSTLYTHMA